LINYKEIALDDLLDQIEEIDVSEHGTVVYTWIDGEVKPVSEEWDRPRRTAASWRTNKWTAVLSLPGVKAWGAYDRQRLTGVIVYRPHLTEKTAQLAALFVSRHSRRQGISKRLFESLEQQAIADGHSELYVSATPSESAVNFYLSCGFKPTTQVDPELYALEPEDIHMRKAL